MYLDLVMRGCMAGYFAHAQRYLGEYIQASKKSPSLTFHTELTCPKNKISEQPPQYDQPPPQQQQQPPPQGEF